MVTASLKVNSAADGTGGNWVTIRPGALQAQWAGWVAPNKMYVMWGGWVDTGYSSYPNVPTSVGQTSSYSSVTITWAGPSGGTPPAYYQCQMCKSDYTPLSTQSPIYTGTSTPFAVSEDTAYVFRTRSVAANGLVSPWVDIRLGIGHSQVNGSRFVQRGRAWRQDPYDTGMQVGIRAGDIKGPTAPAHHVSQGIDCGVIVEHTRYQVWASVAWPTSWDPAWSRYAYWLGNDTADVGGVMSTFNYGLQYGPIWTPDHPKRFYWSNGGRWGIYLMGDGYGLPGNGYEPIYCNIFLAGTEYYVDTEAYVVRNAAGNYYW